MSFGAGKDDKMQEQISLKTELFGHELRVNAARLDEGIQVTIAGGSHSQIKYVTASCNRMLDTLLKSLN